MTLVSWKKSSDKHRLHVKEQRHYFPNKGLYSQSYVSVFFFSVVMPLCKLDHKGGWTLRNWYFWTTILEKTLWVPWTARKSIQSTLKEINPENPPEGLMLSRKLQYYCYLIWRANSLENTLMLEKIGVAEGDDRGPDVWMPSPTQWIWVWTNWEMLKDSNAWYAAVRGVMKSWRWLSDWTTNNNQQQQSYGVYLTLSSFRSTCSMSQIWNAIVVKHWLCLTGS